MASHSLLEAQVDQNVTVTRLVFVYNANWSLTGGLEYIGQLLQGKGSDCALCDITHHTITEKKAWKSCRESFGIPIAILYKNQIPDELRKFLNGEYPAVVAEVEGTYELLLGRTALEECAGDVRRMAEQITASAQRSHLNW